MSQKSEIYAQGYEKWEGQRDYAVQPWWLIAKAGFKNVVTPSGCMGRFVFIFLFIIPLGNYFFLVISGNIARFQYDNLKKSEIFGELAQGLASMFSQANIDPSEAAIHMGYILYSSIVFGIAGMIFYGAQLISKDKWANALQVYFAKAISRTDYILGKFLAVGFLTAIVSLLPSAVILVLGIVLIPEKWPFILESWYVPVLTGSYWVLLTTVLGSITLFFSSIFNKAYMSSVGIIGFSFFSFVFSKLLVFIFGSSNFLKGLDWISGLINVGESIFLLKVENWGLLIWQVIDLSVICVVFIYLIYRNVRPVEVIK